MRKKKKRLWIPTAEERGKNININLYNKKGDSRHGRSLREKTRTKYETNKRNARRGVLEPMYTEKGNI